MYDPKLGRWMQRDPLEADLTTYRALQNNPVNLVDPSGFFGYTHQSGPNFKGGTTIGYTDFRLDIDYQGKAPTRGSFIQISTVTTIVVTSDGKGTLTASTPRVTYILDRPRLEGKASFPDGMAGPNFDKTLTKNAILVISHVVKEQGYTGQKLLNRKGDVTQIVAQENLKMMDPNLDRGTYTYSYLWADAGKGGAIANRQQAILKVLPEEAQGWVKDMFSCLDLDTYKGQKIKGDAGVEVEADLDGKVK
jgi:hypothetical protein